MPGSSRAPVCWWYGNEKFFEDLENNNPNIDLPYDETIHYPALFQHCIDDANNKFIPLCEGLSGTMDNLIIDLNYKRVTEGIPVDVLMMDLVAQNAEGGVCGPEIMKKYRKI
jgi:hypothetical protein